MPTIKGKLFLCCRCGHIWKPRRGKPKNCPDCKSPYWDKPVVRKSVSENRKGRS